MQYTNSIDFARKLDSEDSLAKFRNSFFIPRKNHREVLYFCGNSLGLQPRNTFPILEQELFDWAALGVEGHFLAKNPWVSYHEQFSGPLSKLTGALPSEVVAMGSLTANLHFLLVSFYRPVKNRFKIICEHKPFPSDRYALESHIRFHGFKPEDALIELKPREGEYLLRTEDILAVIEKNKNSLALLMMGGVNYFSGQAFDLKAVSECAAKAGATVGFDLAHAIGNIKLELHYWGVDFACWCSYKYLNSGPGGVGGIFVHEKNLKNNNLPRFNGWWGGKPDKKFLMENEFSPAESAEAWQQSNAPVLSMAAHRASLDIFEEAGMDNLIEKSKKLTGYLEFVLGEVNLKIQNNSASLTTSPKFKIEIITPKEEKSRGCQISFIAEGIGKELYEYLKRAETVTDWREPNIIRLAPVPLYNSFEDVFRFGEILKNYFEHETR